MKTLKYSISFCFCVLALWNANTQNDKVAQKTERKATDLVYEANTLLEDDNFVSAEMEYRKALSKQENNVAGTYNLA
ncbi:MAG: aerotolerance regulator BatC, partial [Winogradskyella sp.]|nr:aerotolerance regulator BatC [Winogradskyella sp.]